ncbi:DNA cytosine methyltransferase [Pseudomonas syringae]|uniref:DNA cytosine methyltransferase n=1 Tax=Pseudomonas syringae TaxID=317 RepID=UPI0001E285C2
MSSFFPFQIVDLFSGPGGLSEGFASFKDGKQFKIIVSAEMDPIAHKTLMLRAYFRLLNSEAPDHKKDYYDYCNGISKKPYSNVTEHLWNKAKKEANCLTLGDEKDNFKLDTMIKDRLLSNQPWVLIGGPPCQAYSLAGRSRNMGKTDYKAEEDHRHFLYLEYLRIIQKNRPTVFVMENVKGILSSQVNGEKIFPKILKDLEAPDLALNKADTGLRYNIFSLVADEEQDFELIPNDVDPKKYIIRAEHYGIPQARHRVILLGVLENKNTPVIKLKKLEKRREVTVSEVIGTLPKLRSKLSKSKDSPEKWCLEILDQIEAIETPAVARGRSEITERVRFIREKLGEILETGDLRYIKNKNEGKTGTSELDDWFLDSQLNVWLNHETRGHMPSDLRRYLYASVYADANNRSPRGHLEFNLPGLSPDHKNWETGKFCDRFKVQVKHAPSTTITSHISKDGHYFIHPDPHQCRSLTVREAARLQTFPDNYFFEGNRTQQYHQVGNAVPPLLASQIAAIVSDALEQNTKVVSTQR